MQLLPSLFLHNWNRFDDLVELARAKLPGFPCSSLAVSSSACRALWKFSCATGTGTPKRPSTNARVQRSALFLSSELSQLLVLLETCVRLRQQNVPLDFSCLMRGWVFLQYLFSTPGSATSRAEAAFGQHFRAALVSWHRCEGHVASGITSC